MRDFIQQALDDGFTGKMSLPGPASGGANGTKVVETHESVRTQEPTRQVVQIVLRLLGERTTVQVALHFSSGRIKRYDVHRRSPVPEKGQVPISEIADG